MQVNQLYKKILILTGKGIFLFFVIISTAFVNSEFKKREIRSVQINIISDNTPQMCTIEDIQKHMQKNHIDIENPLYYQFNFHLLEKVINEKNEVKQTSVYLQPNQELNIRIIERKPIARCITPIRKFYIDDEWKILQTTQSYKVPLIIAETYEAVEPYKNQPIHKVTASERLSSISTLDDIYTTLNVVLSDTLLMNFIDYIYIDNHQQITLYPLIGKFDILVGNSTYFREKMNKLKLFITYGLNKNDAWNRYSHINLKYQNLIYCTKK